MRNWISQVILAVFICLQANAQSVTPPIPEQSMKFYSKGSLINSVYLPNEGDGFVKLFRSSPRPYGSSQMIQLIRGLALDISQKYPGRDRLEIGDIANQNGGKAAAHASHQNGLDADIAFLRINNKEQVDVNVGMFSEKFVKSGAVTANFDFERNWYAIEKLASLGTINRIFVGPAIKRALCQKYNDPKDPLAQKALSILQPLVAHDNHMHVRLNCPITSPHCISQPAMPLTPNCGPKEMEMDLQNNIDGELEVGC